MPVRTANAEWSGNLEDGEGRIEFGDGRFDEPYSAGSRFEDGEETNPEELLAAAHAACYSMALSNALAEAGHAPERVVTEAEVRLEKKGEGFAVTTVDLQTRAHVPGMEEDDFLQCAEEAKENCPVSKALAGCEIKLQAEFAE